MGIINKLLFSDRAPKVIRKSIDFNAQKVGVSAANIANAETPGFKATHLEFESVLKNAASANSLPMKATDSKHIQPQNPDFNKLQPNVEIDSSPGRIDGNNVNLENEMSELAQARIAYDAGITAMMKRGSIVKSAITEVR